MRALVIHNFYRSANASGENLSVTDEITGLRERGWEVEVVSADSDVIERGELPLTQVAMRPVYSVHSVRRVRAAIARFRPHVALVENVFPLHSPAVIRTLVGAGVPVAAGVRSYRMLCAASTLSRDGAHCTECVGSLLNAPAVRHGCYQNSALRSLPIAASLRIHRSTFRRIDTFLAVSDYVRDVLVDSGFAADRIVVRPNFVPEPGPDGPAPVDRSPDLVFAGRLSAEKGVDVMIDAWQRSEVWRHSRLRVAGSGELRDLVERQPAEFAVDALGLVEHDVLMDELRRAGSIVVPSVWPEPFGRGVIEAASLGRPALVTDSGGLPSLVVDGETGWIAEPDVEALAEGFRRAADPAAQLAAGRAARARYETHYTREVSVGILHDTLERLATSGVPEGAGHRR